MAKALSAESNQRLENLLKGIAAYSYHPYRRNLKDPPIVWKKGSARLLDYGQIGSNAPLTGPDILIIPSLINRYYIMDLTSELSFVRFLREMGFRPLVMDWGDPGRAELRFNCASYVTGYLAEALDYIYTDAGEPPVAMGYCMGGLFALALAQLMPDKIGGLALLATPWDFFVEDFARVRLDETHSAMLDDIINRFELLPPEVIQGIFYSLNPWLFDSKFRQFADVDPKSKAAEHFVAIEQWVNDGVAMTQGVAKDCLVNWAQHNATMKGQWKVGGKSINPAQVKSPTFIAMPHNDHIVPTACAQPLAGLMPHATLCQPHTGHIGMMVGHGAQRELWQPLLGWLNSLA